MSEHDPLGSTLCIHSVVVDASYRRQGLASVMLKQYVRDIVEQQQHVTRVVLLAKAHLVGFYVRCGFAVTRLSPVVHGKDPWFELALDCVAARRLRVVQVDAFTTEISQGNPAAVVLIPPTSFDKANVTEWMQRVAIEMNLSETAFMSKRFNDAPSSPSAAHAPDVVVYDLRWCSPECEVALCGHGTLAAAHLLYTDHHVNASAAIHFHTLSGVLVCTRDATNASIAMTFPLGSLLSVPSGITLDHVAASVVVAPASVVAMKQTQTTDVMVHVAPAAFVTIRPDLRAIAAIDARAVVVTAEMMPANALGVDFQSRVFGPRVGVNEVPVTGSAHCGLAAYWSNVLHKCELLGKQATPVRGGFVRVEVREHASDQVLLKGDAIVSLRGHLATAP